MTIPEYYQVMEELKKLPPEIRKFFKDICISIGHEPFKDINLFADVCTRCGDMFSWTSQPAALKKIADAMAMPLKAKLDYEEGKRQR